MAAQLKRTRSTEIELIPGSGGIFDVEADGKLIFSKHKVGRFPTNEEIIELLNPA